MVSTTVSTKIVVEFDDQFTQSANKALENYRKTLEGIKQNQKDEIFKMVDDSLINLTRLKPIELKIFSQDLLQQLGEVEGRVRLLEGQKQLSFQLVLVDGATEDALKIRRKLEETYKTPITQIINVKKIISSVRSLRSSGFSGPEGIKGDSKSNSGGSSNSGNFDGSSVNPDGLDTFGSIKGFSTGIDRVPRDMLTVIHKDETVLNKSEAEDRRQGIAGGVAIQSVNINMNLPGPFNPSNMSRQDFRQLAVQMQDELRRLDRRMSR